MTGFNIHKKRHITYNALQPFQLQASFAQKALNDSFIIHYYFVLRSTTKVYRY